MKNKIKIIDLFAGAGGSSLGYEMSDMEVVCAVEYDRSAANTYRLNHKNTVLLEEDIRHLADVNYFLPYRGKVEGIVMSPPCQGMSLAGNRDVNDSRNTLFMDAMKIVRDVEPLFFVMENVPGLLSMKTKDGNKIIDLIEQETKTSGYKTTYKILNSADYGVPQIRKRFIMIGFRNDLDLDLESAFPKICVDSSNYISVWEAISDLPDVKPCGGECVQKYTKNPTNDYQILMRGNNQDLYNHISMKHTKRMIERFEHIKAGQSVSDVAKEYGQRKRGDVSIVSGKSYKQNNYRVYGNAPMPTIPAGCQSNFIHPYENRNFTPREIARLMSFPDNYIITGNRTHMSWDKTLCQYEQLGNAVPPLLAKSIGMSIVKEINKVLVE